VTVAVTTPDCPVSKTFGERATTTPERAGTMVNVAVDDSTDQETESVSFTQYNVVETGALNSK
jgi:hypothetical protein